MTHTHLHTPPSSSLLKRRGKVRHEARRSGGYSGRHLTAYKYEGGTERDPDASLTEQNCTEFRIKAYIWRFLREAQYCALC